MAKLYHRSTEIHDAKVKSLIKFGVAALLGASIARCAAAQGASQSSVSVTIDVSSEQLTHEPVSQNWLSYNGDYTGRRYSNLDQVNIENVAKLRAHWVFHAPNSDSLEVTPVVVDGMMFVTSANDAYALDA